MSVPTERLSQLVGQMLIWGVLSIVSEGVVVIRWESMSGTDVSTQSLGEVLSGLVTLFAYLVTLAGSAISFFKWVKRAWDTTAHLRGLRPRITANAAAWLTALPYINLLGMIYVMDFLVIRSKSSEERTMNAFSLASKDRLVTCFAYLLAVSAILEVVGQLPRIARLLQTEGLLYRGATFLIGVASFIVGYKLALQVNQQLEQAVQPSQSSPLAV